MNFGSVYFDAHSHLHDKAYALDRKEVYTRMRLAGVTTITIGTDYAESEQAIACAQMYDGVWATVGIHPSDNRKEKLNETQFARLAVAPKVVAIGECGLDYYRLEDDRIKGKIANQDAGVDRQKDLFEFQMEFAATHNLPLMLHGRPSKGTMDAYEDMLYMLEGAKHDHGERLRGDIHFFVGDIAIARRFLDLGFTLSFTGVITFARDYDEVIRYIPLENILLETDAPYVAPTPYRGKRNEPAYVIEVYKRLAEIRKVSIEQLSQTVQDTAHALFRV